MRRFFNRGLWTGARLLAIVPPILLLLVAMFIVRRELQRSRYELLLALTSEISTSLDIDITVKDVDATAPGRLVVRKLALSKKGFGRLLSADRAIVHYSLPKLLQDYDSPASTITSISVVEPIVYLERSKTGALNFVEAFQPKSPVSKQKRFQGVLLVRKGTLRYLDHKFLSRAGVPLMQVARGINGVIDLRSKAGANFNATAIDTTMGGSFKIDGAYGNRGRIVVRGAGADLDLMTLDAFLPSRDVRLTGGKVDGNFLFTRLPGSSGKMNFWMTGTAKNAALKLPGKLPVVSDINGGVSLAGSDLLRLDVSARALGASWRAKGVVLSLGKPDLWLDMSTNAVSYGNLLELASIQTRRQGLSAAGNGPLNLSIRGPVSSIIATGQVAVPRLSYQKWKISDARAKFSYANGIIKFPAVSGIIGQGQAAGFGSIDTRSGLKASGRIRFSNIVLSKIDPRVSGKAWGSAEFALLNGRQVGRVSFQVQSPSAFGRSASSATGRMRIDGRSVFVESLLISTPGGYATAAGSFTTSGLINLNVSGVGLTAEDLIDSAATPLTAGILNVDGEVTGTFRNPVFTGRAQALDVLWDGKSIDEISGRLMASRSRLTTPGITVARGASQATITGRILNPFSDVRHFDLSADIISADLEEVARVFPEMEGISGLVSGHVSSVSGRLDNLTASFSLNIEEARYKLYNAPMVTVAGRYDRGAVTLDSLTVKRGTAGLSAYGAMTREGDLDFNFTLKDFPFDDAVLLAINSSAPVSGMLDLQGHLGGTRESPRVEATLSGKNLNAAGERLTLTDSTVLWTENLITIKGASMTAAGGSVTADSVRISTAGEDAGLLYAGVTIGSDGNRPGSSVDMAKMLAMIRGLGLLAESIAPGWRSTALQLPEHVQGRLSGQISVGTTPAGYLVTANLQAADLIVYGTNLGTVDLAASTGPDGTVVDSLTMEDDDMLVTAKGKMDRDGSIVADVEGNNVDVARIPAVKSFQNATGLLDFSFEAHGTLTDPLIQGSILARAVEISGIHIDRFSTGQITATKDSVTVAESTLGSGGNRIRIAGSAPFSVTKMGFVNGGAVDFHTEAINPTLDVLALFSDKIDVKGTTGDVQAQLNVTGAWPTPQLDGFIRVVDGRLVVKGMQTEFDKVKVDIGFDGRQVSIKEFSAQSTDKGNLAITGGAKIGEKGWETNILANARNMGIRMRNVSGVYEEAFSGRVDVDLGMTGSVLTPLIAGKIVAHSGSFGIPAIPETSEPRKPLVFDPAFDVALIAGRDLRARGPRMNVNVAGQIQLAQSLDNPLVTGQLQVISGYMLFPGSRFRIVPVGLITFRYDQSSSTRVAMDIRAETELSSSARSPGFVGQSYRVEMHARGSIEDPKVTFQSYPPGLESGSIFAMLGERAGVSPSGFSSQKSFEREVAQLFTSNIAPGMLQPVETALADAFGLQEVAIGFGQYEPVNVTLRRKLFDGFSLQYWRALGGGAKVGQQEEEWKLLYDLTRGLRLSFGENRFGIKSVAVEGSIDF